MQDEIYTCLYSDPTNPLIRYLTESIYYVVPRYIYISRMRVKLNVPKEKFFTFQLCTLDLRC